MEHLGFCQFQMMNVYSVPKSGFRCFHLGFLSFVCELQVILDHVWSYEDLFKEFLLCFLEGRANKDSVSPRRKPPPRPI